MSDQSPGPIDFSALDPSHDQLRWTRTVDRLAARALAEHRKRTSVEQQLLTWARPVLAVAAGLCLMVWATGYFATARRSSSSLTTAPALQIAAWAANDRVPETNELSGTLGGIP